MPSPDPSKARRRGRRIDGNLRGTPAPSEPDRHMRMAAQRSQVPFQVLPAKLHTCDKSRPRTLVHGIGDAVRRQSSPTPSVQARLDGAERQRTRPASLERVVGRRHVLAQPVRDGAVSRQQDSRTRKLSRRRARDRLACARSPCRQAKAKADAVTAVAACFSLFCQGRTPNCARSVSC